MEGWLTDRQSRVVRKLSHQLSCAGRASTTCKSVSERSGWASVTGPGGAHPRRVLHREGELLAWGSPLFLSASDNTFSTLQRREKNKTNTGLTHILTQQVLIFCFVFVNRLFGCCYFFLICFLLSVNLKFGLRTT